MVKKHKLGTFYTDNGAVLDHLYPESVSDIIKVLRDAFGEIPLNISYWWRSRKHGRKGRITIPLEHETLEERDEKLEELIAKLTDPEISTRIALLSPRNTISIIKGGKVLTEEKPYKWSARIPDEVTNLVRCPNSNCITNAEDVPLRVYHKDENGDHRFICRYCRAEFGFDKLKDLLTYID